MSWLDGSDLPAQALRIGSKLGAGGQGMVHELTGPQAGFVYKEYQHPAGVNGAALTNLVAFPGRLTSSERDRLLRQTAWPLARVVDGGQVKGFVMVRIPPEFYGQRASGPAPRELQYLLYEPKPLWGDIKPLDAQGRLMVARQAAALFFLLHRKRLVVGDVSMINTLWAPSPVSVFLVDCDGIRVTGQAPVLPQGATPDWDDPQQPPSGPDLESDRYKLALLVTRVLTRQAALRPGETPEFVAGLPERIVSAVTARFAEAAGQRGVRPDAAQWVRALDERGTIELPPLPPVRQLPNLPKAPIEGERGPRQMIQLPPPA